MMLSAMFLLLPVLAFAQVKRVNPPEPLCADRDTPISSR